MTNSKLFRILLRIAKVYILLLLMPDITMASERFVSEKIVSDKHPIDQVRATIQITGTVTDKQNEPLPGATVQEQSSGNGTVTDVNGRFSMSVSQSSRLTISFIGYKTQIIDVNGQKELRIQLQEDSEVLDEVVVVGYGIQRKVNLSGAVDQISSKELEARPITNISKGLQGVIPNLNINFASGEPGKAATINVRGATSINGGAPLILIDGVASDSDELNRLLPEDIETISVMKDASSAAIYGARASFGILLITTKQGKGDRIQVSYNNSFSWKKPTVLPNKTSDPYIYLKLKNIAVLNTPWSSGHVASDERLEWARQRSDNPTQTESIRLNPLDQSQWEYMGNRDWTDYFLNRSTPSSSHQMSVSGATDKTTFYLSGGYNQEDGLLSHAVKKDNYNRYSMRSRVKYKVWDWLNLSNITSYVVTDRQKPSYLGDMSVFYNLAPTDVDKNPDGSWANNSAGIAMAQLNDGGDWRIRNNRFQNTIGAELNFFNNSLRINGNYTYQKSEEADTWYKTKYTIGYGPSDFRELGTSYASVNNTNETYQVVELYGTFNKEWNQHQFTGILGFNQEENIWNYHKAEREGLISGSLPSIGLAYGNQYVNEQIADWSTRGLFYRLNYVYKNRYILEFNGRYDGSSRFPENKRFGFFPSASVAWRADAEPFFESLRPALSQLKPRFSYGSLGNQMVSEYGYIPTMTSRQGNYVIDGKYAQVVTAPGIVSSDYTWEKVTTLNGGVDFGFLNNRLTASIDAYRRDTKGMLTLGKDLPGVLGASEPKENAADMKTTGWELSIAYQDNLQLAGKPLSWSAKFTLSDNQSWITRFDNPDKNLGQYYEGYKMGDIWGLKSDGLFTSKEEIAALDESTIIPWGALEIVPGWPKYKDLNNDGKITKGTTANEPNDLSVIGNSEERYRFGVNLNGAWNGLDVSVFLQGVLKRDYYPLSYLYWGFYQQPYAGGPEHLFDFYRPSADSQTDMAKHSQSFIQAGLADANTDARYPVFQSWLADKNLGTGINDAMGLAIPQTDYLLNGSYLRVKNITIGYTLPAEWTRKLSISKLRLYVSGDNLAEWSGLKKYFDPEAITNAGSFGYVYPFNRQFSFGLNLTF